MAVHGQADAWAPLPLIALSAITGPQDIEAGRDAGFTDYVAKFQREALLGRPAARQFATPAPHRGRRGGGGAGAQRGNRDRPHPDCGFAQCGEASFRTVGGRDVLGRPNPAAAADYAVRHALRTSVARRGVNFGMPQTVRRRADLFNHNRRYKCNRLREGGRNETGASVPHRIARLSVMRRRAEGSVADGLRPRNGQSG